MERGQAGQEGTGFSLAKLGPFFENFTVFSAEGKKFFSLDAAPPSDLS